MCIRDRTYGGTVEHRLRSTDPGAGGRGGSSPGLRRRRLAGRARRVGALLGTVLLLALLAASIGAAGRLAYVGFGPHPVAGLVSEQLRWLEPQVAPPTAASPGAPGDVGPGERAVLQVAFTALATAADRSRPEQVRVPLLRAALARLDSPEIMGGQGTAGEAAPGAFVQGWSLLVDTELARLSGQESDRSAVRSRATPWVRALATVSSGCLLYTSRCV